MWYTVFCYVDTAATWAGLGVWSAVEVRLTVAAAVLLIVIHLKYNTYYQSIPLLIHTR